MPELVQTPGGGDGVGTATWGAAVKMAPGPLVDPGVAEALVVPPQLAVAKTRMAST